MSELQTEGMTFEKVWAMFQETDRKIKENAEQQKETDRIVKENARQQKETDRLIGKLSNSFGELAEHLVAPGIVDKFNAIGFHFSDISRDHEIKDPATGRSLAEVDIILENGDIVIAVEVKAKLKYQDVDKHLARMEVLRRRADRKKDLRKYRGAIAAAILTDETCSYAHKAGLYVLEQSGDTMKLDIPESFVPREW